MERLSVITVPATDLEGNYHTAFTVFDDSAKDLRSSAGWTLRDAIEYYARKYCRSYYCVQSNHKLITICLKLRIQSYHSIIKDNNSVR